MRRYSLSTWVSLGLMLVASAAQAGGAVVEQLVRPAIPIRHPEKAVLLSAAKAGSRLVAVGERGIVIVSDDEGRNWRQVPTPVSVSLTAVRFADDRFGVAVGHGGAVLTTSDAGDSWALRLDGRGAAQMALEAAKRLQDGRALREAEGLVTEGTDKPFLDVLVLDDASILVIGAYGLAFMSDDRGHTWRSWIDRLVHAGGLHLNAARKRGNVIVIGGEQGLVLRSSDAGQSFQRIHTPYKGSFFTVELPNAREILLGGLRGNVWQSRDEGRSWEKIISAVPASIVGSTLRDDSNVLLATQAGYVLEKLENGVLRAVNTAPLPALNQLLHVKDGHLIVLTERGVLSLNLKASPREIAR